MSRFDDAFPVILAHEGGYVDDPADPGGATHYGISLRFLRREGLDLNMDGDVDGDDVRGMTKTAAMALYREFFWEQNGYSRIVDSQVATKVFDLCVNMGAPRAHRLLQKALNACKYTLEVDGVFGPKTLLATNQAEARELLLALCSEAADYYRVLVELKPQLGRFLNGWLKRAFWPFGRGEYVSLPLPLAPVPDPEIAS